MHIGIALRFGSFLGKNIGEMTVSLNQITLLIKLGRFPCGPGFNF